MPATDRLDQNPSVASTQATVPPNRLFNEPMPLVLLSPAKLCQEHDERAEQVRRKYAEERERRFVLDDRSSLHVYRDDLAAHNSWELNELETLARSRDIEVRRWHGEQLTGSIG